MTTTILQHRVLFNADQNARPRRSIDRSMAEVLAEIDRKEQALAELRRPQITQAEAGKMWREKLAECLKETRGDRGRAFALAAERHPELRAAVNQVAATTGPATGGRALHAEWKAKVDECTKECGGIRTEGFLKAARENPELHAAAKATPLV